MNLNHSRSDLATRIRQMLERETGQVFVLKTKDHPAGPADLEWFLYPSLEEGASCFLSHVQQEGSWVIFQTPIFYDTMNVIEVVYPQALGRKKLRADVSQFHEGKTRVEYLRSLPKVIAFFAALEKTVSKVNEDYPVKVVLSNNGGLISAWARIPADEANEQLVKRIMETLKAFDEQIGKLLQEPEAQ